jgi:hypothetical protein
MTRFSKCSIIVLCFFFVGAFSCPRCVSSNQLLVPSPGSSDWSTDASPWTSEKWTGDDKPYSAARLRIEREVNTSHDPLAVVAKYKAMAGDNPRSARATFFWASAAYAAVPYMSSDDEYCRLMVGVLDALAVPPSPHTYEMRYLIQLCGFWCTPDLTVLGHRLLKMEYDDPDVLEQVAVSTPDLTAAIALVRRSIRIRPGRPNSYLHLGEIYYLNSTEPENAERAVQNFRAYQSMAARDRDTRIWVRSKISFLNSKLDEPKTK